MVNMFCTASFARINNHDICKKPLSTQTPQPLQLPVAGSYIIEYDAYHLCQRIDTCYFPSSDTRKHRIVKIEPKRIGVLRLVWSSSTTMVAIAMVAIAFFMILRISAHKLAYDFETDTIPIDINHLNTKNHHHPTRQSHRLSKTALIRKLCYSDPSSQNHPRRFDTNILKERS